MNRRLPLCAAVVFISFSTVGCTGASPEPRETGSAQPAGDQPARVLAPRYFIGASDEDGVSLSTPVAIEVVGERIVVLDRGFSAVRAFTKDGVQTGSFGARGQGPGEFRGATGMAASHTRVYVSELGSRRLHAFSLDDGELIYTRSVTVSLFGPMRALPDDRLLAGALTDEAYADGMARPGVATFSPDGELIEIHPIPDESLTRPERHTVQAAAQRITFFAPFEPPTVWNISTGGAVVFGSGSSYELTVVEPDGRTRRIAGPGHVAAAALLPEEAAWHAALISAKIRIQLSLPEYVWPVEDIATHKPFFTAILTDDDQRTWVVRPTGARRIEDCDETFTTPEQIRQPRKCWEDRLAFDVFSPEGALLDTVGIPSEMILDPALAVPVVAIADGVVWARTRRPDGNEMITGYELRPGFRLLATRSTTGPTIRSPPRRRDGYGPSGKPQGAVRNGTGLLCCVHEPRHPQGRPAVR